MQQRAGRMLEPEEIVEHLSGLNFASNNAPNNETNHRANKETKNNARDNANNTALTAKKLTGKKILITAGPTREPIDPVRFLSNRSSAIPEQSKLGQNGLRDCHCS